MVCIIKAKILDNKARLRALAFLAVFALLSAIFSIFATFQVAEITDEGSKNLHSEISEPSVVGQGTTNPDLEEIPESEQEPKQKQDQKRGGPIPLHLERLDSSRVGYQ